MLLRCLHKPAAYSARDSFPDYILLGPHESHWVRISQFGVCSIYFDKVSQNNWDVLCSSTLNSSDSNTLPTHWREWCGVNHSETPGPLAVDLAWKLAAFYFWLLSCLLLSHSRRQRDVYSCISRSLLDAYCGYGWVQCSYEIWNAGYRTV